MDPLIKLKSLFVIALFIILTAIAIGFYFGRKWEQESKVLLTEEDIKEMMNNPR